MLHNLFALYLEAQPNGICAIWKTCSFEHNALLTEHRLFQAGGKEDVRIYEMALAMGTQ